MLQRFSWVGALILMLVMFVTGAEAETAALAGNEADYAAYLDAYCGAMIDTEVLLLDDDAGLSVAPGETISFKVDLMKEVFGYPVFTYRMVGSNILDNSCTLMVDGVVPYEECRTLTLDTLWLQEGVFGKDRYGNEVASMPEKSYEKMTCRMMGKAGMYSQGMGLYLTQGSHEISITCHEGAFTLYGMTLAGEIPVAQAAQGRLEGRHLITLQAEQVPVRSNPNIRPRADYDLRLSPYSSGKKVINHIEDFSYRYPGDILQWNFQVDHEGWYALALRMRQADLVGFPVYRTILVDGVIPGAEFENAAFDYTQEFVNQTVCCADGTPALVYLTRGEHTLTFLSTVDPVRDALTELNRISDEIAALSLEITKITGGNTDFFRDFSLSSFNFHIAEDLLRWKTEIEAIRSDLTELANTQDRVGALTGLDMAIRALDTLAEKPDDLPKKMTLFAQGSSSARSYLVSTIENLSLTPMGLDAVYFYTDEALLPKAPNGYDVTVDAVARFFASFSDEDYLANTGDETRLQVWVNRPRQYLEILQRMADTSFTPATGIEVDFSIMPDEGKLILANASGSAPDVALSVSAGRVYDLAVRDALLDLRSMDGFKETGKWFPAGLMLPAVCDDGMYALPETFNFNVLFYRKDILDSLGLAVPDSYEEVLKMLPTLHRYGMNYNNYVANAVGYKPFSVTTPFLYQYGATLYESGDLHVQLDTDLAIEAMKLLTRSFTVYDMDFEVNSFYQSFRDGTLPIGTSNYGMYNLLLNAAPELTDKWGMALYPGLTDENGVVQRWTAGAEQSCMIFSSTNMPEESWEFLQWWMSEEIQTEFAYTLQATLGNEYMWNSANVEAFMNSPWPSEHKVSRLSATILYIAAVLIFLVNKYSCGFLFVPEGR